jgi:hypothetical protein
VFAFAEGDHRVGGGLGAGVEVGLGVADRDRRTVAIALQAEQPTGGFDGELGGGPSGFRAILAVGRDRDVDQARVERAQSFVAEAERGHFAGVRRFDEDVRGLQEGEETLAIGW